MTHERPVARKLILKMLETHRCTLEELPEHVRLGMNLNKQYKRMMKEEEQK
jgi:hypothetical protein